MQKQAHCTTLANTWHTAKPALVLSQHVCRHRYPPKMTMLAEVCMSYWPKSASGFPQSKPSIMCMEQPLVMKQILLQSQRMLSNLAWQVSHQPCCTASGSSATRSHQNPFATSVFVATDRGKTRTLIKQISWGNHMPQGEPAWLHSRKWGSSSVHQTVPSGLLALSSTTGYHYV